MTATVSVGLCGLAGRPNITMNECEAWIMDPRTPVKKFAALLFKLANIRHQVFKQLQREFTEVQTVGGDDKTGTPTPNSFASESMNLSFNNASQISGGLLGSAANADSFVSQMNKEGWFSDFVSPVMQRLVNDDSIAMAKLGPLNINKTVKSGYMYFYIGEPKAAISFGK